MPSYLPKAPSVRGQALPEWTEWTEWTCAAGLVCTTAVVAKLGFTGGTKSCMPAHCDNDVIDDDLGETSQDFGGECGCRATTKKSSSMSRTASNTSLSTT